MVEIVSPTRGWKQPGRRLPIRYVLVRDPAGELEPQAFLCTDLDADPLDILLFHPPLVDRGHLRRGPPPPRCGDPTAMVRTGDRPHHASPARLVLPDHALGQ